jgi:hypothetical protein
MSVRGVRLGVPYSRLADDASIGRGRRLVVFDCSGILSRLLLRFLRRYVVLSIAAVQLVAGLDEVVLARLAAVGDRSRTTAGLNVLWRVWEIGPSWVRHEWLLEYRPLHHWSCQDARDPVALHLGICSAGAGVP